MFSKKKKKRKKNQNQDSCKMSKMTTDAWKYIYICFIFQSRQQYKLYKCYYLIYGSIITFQNRKWLRVFMDSDPRYHFVLYKL